MKQLLLFLLATVGIAASAADVTSVKATALDGFGGDTGSVLLRCQTKVGQPYDPATVTHDVNALRESGEFEQISADATRNANGVEIVFFVRRKVRFQAPLVVKGCDFFSESKVASESGLKDGYLYGEADLATAADKVRLAYRKKHFADARVVPSYEIIGANDAKITFEIAEGERRKIRDFLLVGLELAPDVEEKELRTAIGDYPWWNPYGWFSEAKVTAEQQAQCCDQLAEVLRNHGYLDAKVTGPERVPYGEEKVDLRYTLVPGTRYVVGETKITGLTKYPEESVRGRSDLPAAGTVAGAKALDDAAHRIKVTVGSGDSGLADTFVAVKRIPSEKGDNVLDIVFDVKEGVPVVINEVKIRGNDYTMDKVIRREIALGPGDRMLEDRAERSQKRLENLDYFSRVRYYLEATERGRDANGAEYRDLVYEVEEKNTGSFMVGIGASTVDSVYVSAEVSQSNFDIFAPGKLFRGAGQKGRLYVAWGPRYQTLEASVAEPHLFGRNLEFTVEGFRRGRWYDQYDIYRSGAGVSLSYPVKFWPTWNPFGRFGIRYAPEFIEFDDVDWGTWMFGGREVSLLQEESMYGDLWEHPFRFFWSRDTRNSFRMPSSGSRTSVFADLVGAENPYYRLGLNHRSYFTTWKRFNHVFMAALRLETLENFSGDMPIYDRLFLGGPKSIRGVKYRTVSPSARRYMNDDDGAMLNYGPYWNAIPWGGQTLFCMNFEYTVPIVKMLRLAVFSDLGSVAEDPWDLDFSDTFAWSAGLGVRLDIPMFPIRLDFGTPFVKPDDAEEEVFSFTVGYDF